MKESAIETYLVDRCAAYGILCPKFVSPGTSGVNDRIAIPPHGLPVYFIETKAPRGELKPLQNHWCRQILQREQAYALLDTKAKVDQWVAERASEIHKAAVRGQHTNHG